MSACLQDLLSLSCWSVWPAIGEPTCRAFDGGSCLGTRQASTTLTPSDQSDAALWLYFTTGFFNKAIKEQDVPFDTPLAQPGVCAVGGRVLLRNNSQGRRREEQVRMWCHLAAGDRKRLSVSWPRRGRSAGQTPWCSVLFCFVFFFSPQELSVPSKHLSPSRKGRTAWKLSTALPNRKSWHLC